MSMTESYRRWLRTASKTDIADSVTVLRDMMGRERNPMIRASMAERAKMGEQVLADERRWAAAVAAQAS